MELNSNNIGRSNMDRQRMAFIRNNRLEQHGIVDLEHIDLGIATHNEGTHDSSSEDVDGDDN